MPHFPLYIVEALVVEAVALWVPTDRPLRFGLWSGLGIGTVGLAAEWAWSQAWMPLPWPTAIFPEGALLGLVAALAGATIGAWIGSHLAVERPKRPPALRLAAVCSALALAALVAYGLHTSTSTEKGVSARVALHDVSGGPDRQVQATVALQPADAAEDAEWLDLTAWQGGGLVVDRLKQVGPGRYRSTEPIPVSGSWKTMVRLHRGDSLTALPIYLPRDAAIPVGEIPARHVFTREFRNEHKLLQREQTGGSPILVAIAYSVVAGVRWACSPCSPGRCTGSRRASGRGGESATPRRDGAFSTRAAADDFAARPDPAARPPHRGGGAAGLCPGAGGLHRPRRPLPARAAPLG